jgi:hypothetical protein
MSGNNLSGTLNNFALSGGTSNWVGGSPVTNIPVVSAGSNHSVLCIGQSATISATGANSFTWSSGATTSSIAVSPMVNTVYTFTAANSPNCKTTASVTQSVSSCNSVTDDNLASGLSFFPNPSQEILNVQSGSRISVLVKDQLGRLIFEGTCSPESKLEIHLPRPGLYFLHGFNGNQLLFREKVIRLD